MEFWFNDPSSFLVPVIVNDRNKVAQSIFFKKLLMDTRSTKDKQYQHTKSIEVNFSPILGPEIVK
jgi:hypothetical protein